MNMTQAREGKAAKKERIGVVNMIGLVICILLMPVLIMNCILIAKSFVQKDDIPNVAGVFPMIVLTQSMVPTIDAGDLIVCRNVDPETIEEGDIICYFSNPGVNTQTVTHRVIEVDTAKDGSPEWITQGDANNAKDTSPVTSTQLAGLYWFRIPHLGTAAMFMQTTEGLIVCVILPLVLLILFDVIRRQGEDNRRRKQESMMRMQLDLLRAKKAALSQLMNRDEED